LSSSLSFEGYLFFRAGEKGHNVSFGWVVGLTLAMDGIRLISVLYYFEEEVLTGMAIEGNGLRSTT